MLQMCDTCGHVSPVTVMRDEADLRHIYPSRLSHSIHEPASLYTPSPSSRPWNPYLPFSHAFSLADPLPPVRSRLAFREGDFRLLLVGIVCFALLLCVRQTNVLLTGPPFSLCTDVAGEKRERATIFSQHVKVRRQHVCKGGDRIK